MPDDQNEVLDFFGHDVTPVSPGSVDGPQFERPSYVLENLKWGSPTMGTSGGTIRWTIVSSGSVLPSNHTYSSSYTSVDSVFVPTIRAAFARWEEVANFDFVEVTNPTSADIIVAFDELSTVGSSTIGLAEYFYSGATLQRSYVSFDINRRYRVQDGTVYTVGTSSGSALNFYTLVLHEVGHSIGLGHEDDFATVMNSFQDPSLTDLTSDDISGIRAIYGSPSTTPTVDDYPASAATTAQVSVGGTATGRIDSSTDEDWFRVTLTPGNYRIDLRGYDSGGGTLIDPFVRLLNSAGTELASDDDSGAGTDSQLLYTITTAGTYYIAAAGFDGEQGSYTLSVATSSTADDYAAGTSTTGAVSVGGSITGRLETSTDSDWFAVTLTTGQTYRIDVRGTASNGGTLADPYVRVRSSSGAIYASDNDTGIGADAQVTYTAGLTGVHYIEATTLASGTGTYTVSVASVAPVSDDYGATTATTGSVVAGSTATGNIETGGDRDWFRVTLAAGATYRFDLRGSATSGGTLADPYLTLRDGNGTQLTTDDDSGTGFDAQLSYTPTTGGTHFIEAKSASPTATGTYTVGVTTTAQADDYGSTTSTTGIVTPGSPGTAVSGTIGTAGDSDWFRVTLNAGTPYRFRVTNGSLAGSILQLRNSSGGAVAADEDGIGNPDVVYTPTASGSYYLDVHAFSASGTGTYTVAADNLSSFDDYGATVSTAGSIAVGASVNGNIGQAADADWFRVALTAGTLYRFDARGSAAGNGTLADPYLSLLNASGTAVVSDNNSGEGADARIFYTATATATYYLSVRASSDTATGTYAVTAAANPDDYAASIATTGSVTPGGSAGGVVEVAGDHDWFRTTLTAGTAYNIEVHGTASGSGLRWTQSSLVLRDATGAQVRSATASGLGAAASLVFAPTSSGTYFIDTLAYSSGVGSYSVSIASTASAAEPAISQEGRLGPLDILAITATPEYDLADFGRAASVTASTLPRSPFAELLADTALPAENRHRLEAADLVNRRPEAGNLFALPPLG